MDLSTPPLETRGRQAAERLFGDRDDALDPPGMILSRPEVSNRNPQRPSLFRRAPILIAVLVAGLVLYGAIYRMSGNGQQSVTGKLPPPGTSRIAAINLPPPDLLRPLSPEEATKENAERPFVDRPDTPASKFVLRTDTEDRARAITCMAQAIYYEAASEGVDGGRAVAQVVLNRLRHPGYPSTICGVVYEGADRLTGCQFSFTCDGSMQRVPVPSLWNRSRQIAEEALSGRVFAPIGHATHYHADYVLPYWADSLDKTVQIGRHIFYRLRSTLGDSRSFFQRYGGTEPQIREPGAVTVIPPAAVTEQLANALISDDLKGSVKDVERASAQPGSPLLVDSSRGTLLADANGTAAPVHRSKSSTDCPAATDRRQIVALGANDVRASASPTGC